MLKLINKIIRSIQKTFKYILELFIKKNNYGNIAKFSIIYQRNTSQKEKRCPPLVLKRMLYDVCDLLTARQVYNYVP